MSNIEKANKLKQVVELLAQADKLQQEAIGASDNCYEVHNAIEDLIDTIEGFAEQLEEMQITE